MLKHIFVIDGSNIAHANQHATKLTVGGMQVQAIFGFLKSLRAMLEANPGMKPLVLWDGKAQWRLDIFPEYKGNRVAKDAKEQAEKDAYQAQMPFLYKLLELAGIAQMRSPLLEADDLAAYIVPGYAARGGEVTMITGDQDWLQLVRPGVAWHDPVRDNRVTVANFYEFTGFKTPEAFVEGKALQGDTSDNIKGVGGIGEKGAPLLLAQYGSVFNLFAKVDAGEKLKLSKAVTNLVSHEGRALLLRNMALMDMRVARRPAPGEVKVTELPPDRAKFEALCKRLAFVSILREMDKWERILFQPSRELRQAA